MTGMQIDKDFILTAPTSDYFAAAVTGAIWTLTNNRTPEDTAYQVSLENLSITDHSAKTWTIVGKDADGKDQTETLAMPGSSATVESAGYYSYVTSITPSATIGADTMNITYADEAVSPTIVIAYSISNSTLAVIINGTANYTGQYTLSKIQDNSDLEFLDVPSTSSVYQQTASNSEVFIGKATALRVKINSFTGTQTNRIQITQ
jgi:hypothetical protein